MQLRGQGVQSKAVLQELVGGGGVRHLITAFEQRKVLEQRIMTQKLQELIKAVRISAKEGQDTVAVSGNKKRTGSDCLR